MEVELTSEGPDVEDEGGMDALGVNVSISEVDGSWHSATSMIPVDSLTPDAIAGALISCAMGVAAQRGPATTIALQQRLMQWGA